MKVVKGCSYFDLIGKNPTVVHRSFMSKVGTAYNIGFRIITAIPNNYYEMRGGSCSHYQDYVRCACGSEDQPDLLADNLGFRVIKHNE